RRSIRRIRLAPRPQGADRVPAAVAAVPPALLQNPRGAAWLGAMPAKSRPPQDESAETPHYHGHRERLRERFYNAGPDALSDYELLELALFAAIPRRDTKPLAKALLNKFGSFAEVIHAPEARLREAGLKDAS